MSDYKRGDERIVRVCDVNGPRTSWHEVGGLVRCSDCANLALATDGSRYCAHWSRRVSLDGFCHLGEREESE